MKRLNLQFTGWYEAPFPFGKTDFTLLIENCADSGDFSGVGSDKQGEFTVRGKVDGAKVTFVKDYKVDCFTVEVRVSDVTDASSLMP